MISKIKDKSVDEIYYKIEDRIIKTILKFNEYYGKDLKTTKTNKVIINLIDTKELNVDELLDDEIEYLIENYLEHKFNLLGSGWIKNNYNINPTGLEGNKYDSTYKFDKLTYGYLRRLLRNKHYERAKKYYNLISNDYNHIDWQIDFKSGYRYSEKIWYKNQPIAPKLGVDIKVPWELSRLQHLLQMAIYSLKFTDKREVLVKEFRNQVIDFIMMNPVNMGVNWACTMEVAIRSINLLLSFDIFKQIDNGILDESFCNIFINYINEHKTFIENNLEWNKKVCNNHYLSNLVGIIYIEAYLGEYNNDIKSNTFAVNQFIYELDRQFNKDGSNFEASTTYHVLSSELMVLGIAIIERFNLIKDVDRTNKFTKNKLIKLIEKNTPKFSINSKYISIMEKLILNSKFVEDVMFNNEIIQIGDNDSGRVVKLTPVLYLQNNEMKENILNKGYYIDLANGLFGDWCKLNQYKLEYTFIKCLCKSDKIIDLNNSKKGKFKEIEKSINDEENNKELTYICRKKFYFREYEIDSINLDSLKRINYNDFGIAIIRNENIFLSIMYGEIGQHGNGGHAHNDKLSVELIIGKYHILRDKGSYLYTPICEKRNEYRSVYSHNVPIVNGEEQDYFSSLFSMKKKCICNLIQFTNNIIKVLYEKNNVKILRTIIINEDSIEIVDRSNFKIIQHFNFNTKNTKGYGEIIN